MTNEQLPITDLCASLIEVLGIVLAAETWRRIVDLGVLKQGGDAPEWVDVADPSQDLRPREARRC